MDENGRSVRSYLIKHWISSSKLVSFWLSLSRDIFDQVDISMTYENQTAVCQNPYICIYNPSIRERFLGWSSQLYPAVLYCELWRGEPWALAHSRPSSPSSLLSTSSKDRPGCQDDDDDEEKPAYNMDDDDDWAEQQHQGRSENGASPPFLCNFYWKSDEVYVWIFKGCPIFRQSHHGFTINFRWIPISPSVRARERICGQCLGFLSPRKPERNQNVGTPRCQTLSAIINLKTFSNCKNLWKDLHITSTPNGPVIFSDFPLKIAVMLCAGAPFPSIALRRMSSKVRAGRLLRDGSHLGMVIRSQPFMLVMFGDGFNTCL